MDRRNEPEQREPVIPEKQRIVRRRRLLFSGQTSEQFQQEVRNATSSFEGRTVSEQEVLSGDHSHISEVPSIYPVYHQALGNYKFYRVASGNPTTDDYAFIDCTALSRGDPLLHFTNDPDSDRFPSLDPTTGRTKYVRIGRSHGKDDWFWLPSSHQEAQQILRGSNQQMQEKAQDQQLLMPDLDPAGLSPREANLTEQDENQVALSSPENSLIRPETERRKTASQKRREFTSREPEPSAHPTEMRPTKKRKVMTNQEPFGEAEPSRPQTYEEWKASAEGQNPRLKPVRSPDGQIYGYNPRDFPGFLEKTKMQERPPKDRIEKRRALNRVVNGEQLGAGNDERQWTSPDPAIQQKLQTHLMIEREKRNKWYHFKKDSEQYEEFLAKKEKEAVKKKYEQAGSRRPEIYEEWKASEEGQDPHLKPVRSPGRQIYGYHPKDFESFCKETGMQKRPDEDRIGKKQLDEIVRGSQTGAGKGKEKWTSPDPAIQQKLQKRLDKKRVSEAKNRAENKLEISNKRKKKFEELKANPEKYKRHKNKDAEKQRERRKKLKDPEFVKAFLEKKYQKEKENHDIAMYQLKTSMNNASPSQQEELQNEEQDLISQWDTFQKQYQADQEKLKHYPCGFVAESV